MACHLKPSNFYRCIIESILLGCITAWYGNCTTHNCRALQRVVRSVQRITGDKLLALQDTYSTRCHRKAKKVIKDNNHPRPYLFTPLPSRRRGQYRCIQAGTKRQKLFFNLKATVKQSSLAQRGCCLTYRFEESLATLINGTLVTLIMPLY